ncbi:hypothetical protein GYMLUDRAFT_60430 [Collybiopsis luxurians FD-317 M1]|uniref:Uncharacterized protein n=1 Tax=Collybiopsis luxurians FD-317 M1 TaxID=944289 RepID=A0A0D0B692_9AGAR|nr:hypothetical protein GYMLUDRAFT_60430 [Collybiopsis luxurians FD-317 M1]
MAQNFPEEYGFCMKTGALISFSEVLEHVRVSIVLVIPAEGSEGDKDNELDEGSAIGKAEQLMERASEKGNFEALWELTFKVFEVQRKGYLESILGIMPKYTTITAELAAVSQLYCEPTLAWATRPVIEETALVTNDNPWMALNIPKLTVPKLEDSTETHVLWYLLHGHPKSSPGITYTCSRHVNLATVQTAVMLKQSK